MRSGSTRAIASIRRKLETPNRLSDRSVSEMRDAGTGWYFLNLSSLGRCLAEAVHQSQVLNGAHAFIQDYSDGRLLLPKLLGLRKRLQAKVPTTCRPCACHATKYHLIKYSSAMTHIQKVHQYTLPSLAEDGFLTISAADRSIPQQSIKILSIHRSSKLVRRNFKINIWPAPSQLTRRRFFSLVDCFAITVELNERVGSNMLKEKF